jgi:cadmium resistance protein CadD (predicted permease)
LIPGVIGLAVIVFVITNVDDILLLAAFLADRSLRPRAIVAGQFVGIAILRAARAVAAVLALAVPEGWLGLLGFAPRPWRTCLVCPLDAR